MPAAAWLVQQAKCVCLVRRARCRKRSDGAGSQEGGECNFENLSMLVAICHCLLPLLAIPLTFVLIPDKLMTDKIGAPAWLMPGTPLYV